MPDFTALAVHMRKRGGGGALVRKFKSFDSARQMNSPACRTRRQHYRGSSYNQQHWHHGEASEREHPAQQHGVLQDVSKDTPFDQFDLRSIKTAGAVCYNVNKINNKTQLTTRQCALQGGRSTSWVSRSPHRRKRMETSKVAPPHISRLNASDPITRRVASAALTRSSVRIRVARSD